MLEVFSILFLSFGFALSGAMVPGPLLTYTIIKTLNNKKNGYLTGIWVISGHAIIELVLFTAFILGFSIIFKNNMVVLVIGIPGSGFLCLMGIQLLKDVISNKIDFFNFNAGNKESIKDQQKKLLQRRGFFINNPVLGGIIISMSNPYWWIWWASLGSGFMIQFNVSLDNVPNLFAFYFGHELGDLAWYGLVSVLFYFGQKIINQKVYRIILAICALFLIIFGIYLGSSVFIKYLLPLL